MLPLLRLIVADIRPRPSRASERRLQLHRLVRQRDKSKSAFYREEVEETRADLRVETEQLEELIRELEKPRVILRSAYEGIIDFPTVLRIKPPSTAGRWGELDVAFWHLRTRRFPSVVPEPRPQQLRIAGRDARTVRVTTCFEIVVGSLRQPSSSRVESLPLDLSVTAHKICRLL